MKIVIGISLLMLLFVNTTYTSDLTLAQKQEQRRESNRISAHRARARRKALLEYLKTQHVLFQQDRAALIEHVHQLRGIVTDNPRALRLLEHTIMPRLGLNTQTHFPLLPATPPTLRFPSPILEETPDAAPLASLALAT